MEFKELLSYHSNCEIQGSKLKTGEGPGMILPGIGTRKPGDLSVLNAREAIHDS